MIGRLSCRLALFCMIALPVTAHSRVHLSPADAAARAIEHDHGVRALRREIHLATTNARLSRRDLLPSLTLGYSMMDSVRSGGTDGASRRLSAGVEQLITNGGRRRAGHHIESERVAALLIEYDEQVRTVTSSALEHTVRLLAEERTLALMRRSLAVAEEQFRILRVEHSLGMVTDVERAEFELAVRGIELDSAETHQRIRRMQVEAARIIGLDPDTVPAFDVRIDPDYRGGSHLFDVALDPAPPVLRAAIQNRIAEHELRAVRSVWFPEMRIGLEVHATGDRFPLQEPGLTLTASLRFATPLLPGESRVTAGTPSPEERTRGFTATANPGDGTGSLLDRARARHRVEQSRLILERTEDETADAIRDAIERINLTRDRIELLQRRGELEREIGTIRLVQVELGEMTRIRALEQEVAAVRTEVELIRTVAALFAAELALARLVAPVPLAPWDIFLEEET